MAGHFKKKVLHVGAAIHPIEAHTPNANLTEQVICELKRLYRTSMLVTNSPECLWDLCLQYVAAVRSHTALSICDLEGKVPATQLTGNTADISHMAVFGWYNWVWFLLPEKVNMERRSLGRYSGPSTDVGDALCTRIIMAEGKFVNRTLVFPPSCEDARSKAAQKRQQDFEFSLKDALGS